MYDEVMMRLTAEGALQSSIQQLLPLAQAMQRLLQRKRQGRIVLRTHGA